MKLNDFRCYNCNRLLGRIKGEAEIKCPKCKIINYAEFVTGSVEERMRNEPHIQGLLGRRLKVQTWDEIVEEHEKWVKQGKSKIK